MIAITGATGQLGQLVLPALRKHLPAEQLVALVRSPERAAQWAKEGVQVRPFDYEKPESLAPALAGVKKLLLISGNELGKRAAQHARVIDAAKAAGVELIAYTSVLRADTSVLPVAGEHVETEQHLARAGVPYVLLRNGWYLENYTADLSGQLAQGAFLGSAGEGRIKAASRADYAEAAARVLREDGHAGRTYELAGDQAFTLRDLAAEVSRWAGRELPYRNVDADAQRSALRAAGLPDAYVEFFVATDAAVARGDLDSDRRDLHELLGRDTETLRDVLARKAKPE